MDNQSAETYSRLAEKYSHGGALMYTEYPHRRSWSDKFSQEDFRTALGTLTQKTPALLYLHIPFCEQLCLFCTCFVVITSDYNKAKHYLDLLYKEIDIYKRFFDKTGLRPDFHEVHLGGGSPTFLKEPDFDELIKKLRLLTNIDNLNEFSIEIDPRRVSRERILYYHSKGINRISFGIQDIEPSVQKAINRVQPAELTENLLTPEIRSLFCNGINFDIICGLPWQTVESIKKTMTWVTAMSPDRICLNYLHYEPGQAKHQLAMINGNEKPKKLPNFYERKILFLEAMEVLTSRGYVRTGYDHFTKPTDSVAKAMLEGKMQWNSLGVTSGRYTDIIGLGVHSYGTIGKYYIQNFENGQAYKNAVENGLFPIWRGCKLTDDDILRREVIQSLRNYFVIKFNDINNKYGIDFKEYFKKEIKNLSSFSADSLIEIGEESIIITDMGQQFTNLICKTFDIYSF